MSGILDSKSRVLDTIITTEGKRQLVLGGIDIKYVTYTDAATFYKADVVSGSQDATRRIYLESCQLPQDDITFLADEHGNVSPFRNDSGVQSAGGRMLSYSFEPLSSSIVTGSVQGVSTLTGSAFESATENLLGATFDNYKKLRVIATKDKIFEDNGFALGPNPVTFTITNNRPIVHPMYYTSHIGSIDSIFSDAKLSRLPNFKYLPPVNKVHDKSIDKTDAGEMSPYFVGTYMPLGRTRHDLTYAQTKEELRMFEQMGYMIPINFDPTSAENRIVGQFFEKDENVLCKMDIIDFGIHQTGDQNSPTAHIFFVGKVKVDEKGTDTFLHIFTLVFE